jgi:hypothetical protein
MKLAILRWVLYFAAILIAGPLAAAMFAGLRLADGSPRATVLLASPVVGGIVALIVAVLLAVIMGVLTARLVFSVRAGMIAAGLVLIWPAFRSAQADELIRSAGSAAPLWPLGLEGAIVGVLGLAAAVAIIVLGGAFETGDDPTNDPPLEQPAPRGVLARTLGTQMLLATGAGVLAGAAAAFFVAATPLRGQAIGGAIVGALAAAVAARLVDLRAPLPGLMIPVAILAVLGPLSGALVGGSVQAAYAGRLFPIANITPLDWLAGGFLGIPLGVAWAASMVDKRHHGAQPAPTRAG